MRRFVGRGLLALILVAGFAVLALRSYSPGPRDEPSGVRAGAGASGDAGNAPDARSRAGADSGDGDPADAEPDPSAWCGTGRQTREPDGWRGALRVLVVREGTDDPIDGADVRCYPDRDEPPRSVVTGVDGRAEVPRWSSGGSFVVTKRGFVAAWIDTSRRSALGDDMRVELAPGAPLRGQVVRGANGVPVADAELAVWPGDWHDSWGEIVRSAADGTFEFGGVPEDETVSVIARAPGLAPAVVVSPPRDPRDPLRIRLGDGGTIEGTVQDASGRAVGDADVVVVEARSVQPEILQYRSSSVRRVTRAEAVAHTRHEVSRGRAHRVLGVPVTRTSGDGRFEIRGIDLPARLDVYAVSEQRVEPGPRRDSGDDGEADDEVVEPTVRFLEGRVVALDLSTDRPTVRADVVVADLARVLVRVLRADGSPAGSKDCSLTLDGPWGQVLQLHQGRPEAGGLVEIERVYPGNHVVFVDAAAALDAEIAVRVAAGECAELTVRLDRGGSVRGRVVDDRGVAIAGAKIGFSGPGDEYADATCGADGAFEISGISDAEGELTAAAVGFATATRDAVRAGSDVGSIALERAASIVGRVPESARGGKVLVSIRTAEGDGWSGGLDVAEDGSFAFAGRTSIRPRVATEIAIAARGHAPILLRGVVLGPGETRDLGTIEFPKGVTMRGTVVGPDGGPLRGATVSCDEWWAEGRTTTDASGSFELANLVSVPCLFRVEAAELPRTWIELTPSDDARPAIRIARGGTLRGRLTGSALAAFRPGDHLDVCPCDGAGVSPAERWFEVPVSSAGTFEMRLPAGRHRVGFHRMRGPAVPRVFEIADDRTTEVEIGGE